MKNNSSTKSITSKYSSLVTSKSKGDLKDLKSTKSTQKLHKYNAVSTENNLNRNNSQLTLSKSPNNLSKDNLNDSQNNSFILNKSLTKSHSKPVKGFIRRDSYVEKYNDTQEFLRKRGETEQEWKRRIARLREEMRLKEEKEKQERQERLLKLIEEQQQLLYEQSLKASQQSSNLFQNNGANLSIIDSEDLYYDSLELKKGKERRENEKEKENAKGKSGLILKQEFLPKDKPSIVVVVDRQKTEETVNEYIDVNEFFY